MTKHQTSNIEYRTSNPDVRAVLSRLDVGCSMLGISSFGGGRITIKKKIKIKTGGFTLIEVLLAVGIFAIVLFAMNTVFYSALRLERATNRAVDERLPLNQALAILRRDLQCAAPPMTNSYLLPRDFVSGGGSGFGASAGASLEFYTTTGIISDDAAWGDLQKVRYELVEPTDRANSKGQELVRVVTRNVLATTAEQQEEQTLVGDVESVEFLCYNGTDWRSTWDTAGGDTGLPLAVRVRIQLAMNDSGVNVARDPLELLVPISSQALTNQLAGGAL
jgi:type II secretion system protein J